MNQSNQPQWINYAKKVWGEGAPKGFKMASWGVAFGLFSLWYYIDNNKNWYYTKVIGNNNSSNKDK